MSLVEACIIFQEKKKGDAMESAGRRRHTIRNLDCNSILDVCGKTVFPLMTFQIYPCNNGRISETHKRH
jgi:hypothetical protein